MSDSAHLVEFESVASRRWGAESSAFDLVSSPGRAMTYEHMPRGDTEVTHLHDRAHHVFHVIAGTLRIETPDAVLVAHARDTIEVPPGVAHRAHTGDDSDATFLVLSMPSTVGDRREPNDLRVMLAGIRRAVGHDVAELVRLRRLMFDEMGLVTSDTAWVPAATEILEREMATDRLVAMVADAPGETGALAASGIVQFDVGLPFPGIVSPGRAYISSMSTDRSWRGRGLAGRILGELLAECDRRNVEVIGLHATAHGRSIYERFGFTARGGNPELRLVRRRQPVAAGG